MDDKTIIKKANEYVKKYRGSLENNNASTRGSLENSMLVIFLGDELDDCKITCENTMNNIWMNCDSKLTFFDIHNDSNDEDISILIEKLFTKLVSQRLQVNIVTKVQFKLSDKIYEIISKIYYGLCDYCNSIDFYIYSIFKIIGQNSNKSLVEHLSTIENSVFNKIGNDFLVYSIIVGDKLTGQDTSIYNEAVASSMVLINNARAIRDYGIKDKSHSVIGFSQADIPLETIYIVGFDTFSDIIIEYFRLSHKQILNKRFDIKTDILKNYIKDLDVLKSQLEQNSKYLWHSGQLKNGEYSFDEINEEYGDILVPYFEANLSRKGICSYDDKKITEVFNDYLFDYFVNYGLNEAIKHLNELMNTEKYSQQAYIELQSYNNQSYHYDKNKPEEAVKKIIEEIINTHINDIVVKIRNIIISIGEDKDNLLKNIEEIFKTLETSTERCKQESVIKDRSLDNTLKTVYENVINDKKEDIHAFITSKAMSFDFSSKESFSCDIFREFEDKIVEKQLFVNLKNYADDTNLYNIENIEKWLRKQCESAEFSMDIADANTLQCPIYLTDIKNTNEQSDLAIYLKNNNCNCVDISGIPVFRTFCFRVVEQKDLTLIQNYNRKIRRMNCL